MTGGGYNPLRWKCDERGCFNKKKRPKIEVFHDCFPGRVNFGDVDGIVELNGQFLWLEWKEPGAPLPTAQRIMYERAPPQFTVLIIWGDAETMVVQGCAVYREGKCIKTGPADLDRVRKLITAWRVKIARS